MKFLKKLFYKQEQQNQQINMRLHERVAHMGRKMSRGASNIFKSLRTHSQWGYAQLSKGHHAARKFFKKK